MKNNKIAGFSVDRTEYHSGNPLIIAELGTSHNGDISRAKELVAAAAEAGAGCCKLQMVFADEILHPNTGEVPLPGGKIRLYDRFKQLELPPDFYAEVKEYSESMGLLFLCTPFGLKSALLLHALMPKIVKIASPELNFTGLLDEIALWDIPILLSCGVSTLGDIEEAVSRFKNISDNRICLLHCITSYPAPEAEYNIRLVKNLSAIFGIPSGVSDHSLDPELVPTLAITQGAAVIEKHFCLSHSDPGLDDPIALPPAEFALMVKAIRSAVKEGPEKTIVAATRQFGDEKVKAVLGSGVKTLASSEQANYTRTNRSIHALHDIHPGDVLASQDFAVLRTEKILSPGLPPYWAEKLAGKIVRQFIPSGEGIKWEDIC